MKESRPGDAFQPGDLLNNTYRIEALLGRGGTSDVYKAQNDITGRSMAVKVLKSEFSGNEDYTVLLKREEQMRDIRHDAVVRYSECIRTQEGLVCLTMDYVEGPGLDSKLKQAPLPANELLTICQRVAGGLLAAHDNNIVHRDLSPDNIILRDGDPAQAVIIDFGIAKDTNPGAMTIVGNEFAGKYAYAAPEQLEGRSDTRTDIYSLGALLLANFRGKPPDIGKNLLDVLDRKRLPLDTTGVPEPLKTLIDRMTAPDANTRFQSAGEVLAFLETATSDLEDDDATVIVPLPQSEDQKGAVAPTAARPLTRPLTQAADVPAPAYQTGAPAPATSVSPAAVSAETDAAETQIKPSETGGRRRSRTGIWVVLLALLIGGGGAGAYFGGYLEALTGPRLPVADPYALVIAQAAGGEPSATGHVPTPSIEAALTALMRDHGGTAELTLARGDIAESWGADVLTTVEDIDDLDEWRLVISGNRARVTGKTSDQALAERLSTAYGNDLPGALEGVADIAYAPVFLAASDLEQVLDGLADCGPLTLSGAPAVGYGPTTQVIVQGRVAGTATRVRAFDALRAVAGDRQIVLNVEVLNEALCAVQERLPAAPGSDIDIAFWVGETMSPNRSGRFFVGENPVIDIVLPADVTTGFISVSIIDVSGNVYHLLPYIGRQDNSVRTLREGREGEVSLRVAFEEEEAKRTGRILLKVDETSLGKSQIIVLHSTEPLFDGLRPGSESALGYAEALTEYAEANDKVILSMDSRILVTATP